MAGRHPRPVAMLKANNTHMSKADLERRAAAEIKIGGELKTAPPAVRANKKARAKWREVVELIGGLDFITSADRGAISRYCLAFAEWQDLVERREALTTTGETLGQDAVDAVRAYMESGAEPVELPESVYKIIAFCTSTQGIMAIDKAINAKLGVILQLEDRLFLNPLAKIRNIPRKEKDEETPLEAAGFDDV